MQQQWQTDEDDRSFEPYKLGEDEARDRVNCELYWAWKKFDARCTLRKLTGHQRNRHIAQFAEHLRQKLGTSMVEPGYDAARRDWEQAHMPAPACYAQR